MANHKSAVKKAKQDVERRARNRAGRSRLRTALKKYRSGMADNQEGLATELPALVALIDQSAKHGFIHHNAADRLKSNLTRQTNKLAS